LGCAEETIFFSGVNCLMVIVNNASVQGLVRDSYTPNDLINIKKFLRDNDSLCFPSLENGLFSAALLGSTVEYTGYQAVWVRDNIHVAHAHYLLGTDSAIEVSVRVLKALLQHVRNEKSVFEAVIREGHAPVSQMDRPHIRFDGKSLERIDQEWNHAQNDAWGYLLWFYCTVVLDNRLELNGEDISLVSLFPAYFNAIQYWNDADSGHWEEPPKVEASSIGVVLAGLHSLKRLLLSHQDTLSIFEANSEPVISLSLIDDLIDMGENALEKILPWESKESGNERRYDSALLFLIYPLNVTSSSQADQILDDVINNLQGDYGISRYLGDSFWCRDYRDIPINIRTTIASEREKWFKDNGRELKIGEEAQWCIFDPVISAIYGVRYQESGNAEFLHKQTHYFNRSLGQLTAEEFHLGPLKCPELYYMQHGRYVPNDATPLLWTQANLLIAITMLERSLLN
jgi:hypothetical protein